MVLRFFKWNLFFFVGGFEFLLSMVWKQERSLNGDAVVFDSIETYMSFSSVWCVCVCVCVCCYWTQDDCVLRELPSEVRSIEILRSNGRRMCNSEDN